MHVQLSLLWSHEVDETPHASNWSDDKDSTRNNYKECPPIIILIIIITIIIIIIIIIKYNAY